MSSPGKKDAQPPEGRPPGDDFDDPQMAKLLHAFGQDVRSGAQLFEAPVDSSERWSDSAFVDAESAKDSKVALPTDADAHVGSQVPDARHSTDRSRRRTSPPPKILAAAALFMILIGGFLARMSTEPPATAPLVEWVGLSSYPRLTRTGGVPEFRSGEIVYVHLSTVGEGPALLLLVHTGGVQWIEPIAGSAEESSPFTAALAAGESVPWQFEARGPIGPQATLIISLPKAPSDEELADLLERSRNAWKTSAGDLEFDAGVEGVLRAIQENPMYSAEGGLLEHIEG